MSLSAATKSNSKGFLDLITCHSFNEKRTQVAVGTASEIYIYDCSTSTDPTQWTKLHTLAEVRPFSIYMFMFPLIFLPQIKVMPTDVMGYFWHEPGNLLIRASSK